MRMPEIRIPRFLRAIDGSATYAGEVRKRYPREMDIVDNFRRRVGDNCNYVKHAVRRIWMLEYERVGERVVQDLRAALAQAA